MHHVSVSYITVVVGSVFVTAAMGGGRRELELPQLGPPSDLHENRQVFVWILKH